MRSKRGARSFGHSSKFPVDPVFYVGGPTFRSNLPPPVAKLTLKFAPSRAAEADDLRENLSDWREFGSIWFVGHPPLQGRAIFFFLNNWSPITTFCSVYKKPPINECPDYNVGTFSHPEISASSPSESSLTVSVEPPMCQPPALTFKKKGHLTA